MNKVYYKDPRFGQLYEISRVDNEGYVYLSSATESLHHYALRQWSTSVKEFEKGLLSKRLIPVSEYGVELSLLRDT